ncbi:MAG: hypothetical protein ABFE07_16670 [Armatimonadia bacterium]
MFGRLARLFLGLVCFPLLGAYSLRWVGAYLRDLVALTGPVRGLPMYFDLFGALAGLVLGLLLAVQIIGSAMQPEESPVRPVADNILIILALTLLVDVVLTRALPDSAVIEWLPVVTLVIWTACAAATMSLTHMRRDLRRQTAAPLPPPPGPQPLSPPEGTSDSGWRSY